MKKQGVIVLKDVAQFEEVVIWSKDPIKKRYRQTMTYWMANYGLRAHRPCSFGLQSAPGIAQQALLPGRQDYGLDDHSYFFSLRSLSHLHALPQTPRSLGEFRIFRPIR